ncbi:restriction endonuclease subunit S [Frigoribacterium faeni]|uniref:restriction endonuclease subunit S n=1 Tax=Frigoribacterium faeni TaxID=145483 RepID=UPI002413AC18|nr:restriction endonuclease subunit S [Frigoribacterium faeni]
MREVRTTPLKFIGKIVSGGTPKSDAENWDGDTPFVTPPDLNGVDGGLVERWERSITDQGRAGSAVVENAMLLSCRAPIGHIGFVEDPVAFNQGCKAIIPERREDLRYLGHALVAHRAALQAAGRGTTFLELSTTELASFEIPWPEPDVRLAIADYLDREIGEINAMIAKLDEMVGTLGKRRIAVIDRVFLSTPESPTVAVHLLADVTVGIVIEPSKLYVPQGAGVPALRGLNIAPGRILSENIVDISHEGHRAHSKSELRRGDVVTVRTGRVGTTAVVTEEWDGSNAIDLVITRLHDGIDARFFYWYLTSSVARAQIDNESVGSVQSHFNVGALNRLRVPAVDPDEQNRIAERLDEVTGRIDEMLAKVADLTELLLERRSALISDVVTGRKDIP